VNTGDTVHIPIPGTSYDSHLWILISDPSQGDECVIVNFTSWRQDKDQACIVEPGEHPYVQKRTCVNYKDAKRLKTSDLERLIASRHLKCSDPVPAKLLQKIRDAIPESRMNGKCVQLLEAQGVILL
jgi:hypothetical protein